VIALLVALAALAVGPLLARALRGRGGALYALDGFVLMAMGGLVAFELLPEAVRAAGSWALVAAVAGFALPSLAERALRGAHRRAHQGAVLAACAGLVLHAAIDGAALAVARAEGDSRLRFSVAAAIALHRLPVGLLLEVVLRPLFGKRAAGLGLVAIGVATIGGWLGGQGAAGAADLPITGLLLAAVAGALLHVLAHQTAPAETQDQSTARRRSAYGAGGATLALIGLVLLHHGNLFTGLEKVWTGSYFWLMPYWMPVLLGGPLAALATTLLPAPDPARGGGPLSGLHVALVTPVCTCGRLPVYEDLVGHGRGRAAVAFLLGSPFLSFEALGLGLAVLGWRMVGIWLAAGLVGALGVATVLGGALPRRSGAVHMHSDSLPPRTGGVAAAWRYLRGDWLDHHAAWHGVLLLGALALALIPTGLGEIGLGAAPWRAVAIGVLLGWPLQWSPAAAVLAGTVLLTRFLDPAGVAAFLVLAPTTGVASRRVLRRLHGRAGLALDLVPALLAVAAGAATAAWVPGHNLADLAQDGWLAPMRLRPAIFGAVGANLVLAALAVPLALSFLRCGPRGWLAELLPAHRHDHAHHPGADHAHEPRAQVQVDLADGS